MTTEPSAADLFMVQLELDTKRLMQVAREQRWSNKHWDDLGYVVHHQLTALFGGLAPQPFRILGPPGSPGRGVPRHGRCSTVVGYANDDGEALQRRADEFAMPADLGALRSLVSKPMPRSVFSAGRKLGFEARLCPTVRLASELRSNWDGKAQIYKAGVEIDAFLRWRLRNPDDDTNRADVYRPWLAERMSGCTLESVSIHAFKRTKILRRGRHDGERRSINTPVVPDTVFQGQLRVDDAEMFRDLVFRGVGRHRAFGFGMLLIRSATPG